ncbi:hypothetical protein ASG89_27855 [Paenibacillus sp. Soil766]|nr:hypothetical protein ASG89_27855 [Paenibacillus sp. Soil766]
MLATLRNSLTRNDSIIIREQIASRQLLPEYVKAAVRKVTNVYLKEILNQMEKIGNTNYKEDCNLHYLARK